MFLSDDGEDDDVAEGAAGELGPATHPRMHDDLLLGQAVHALVVVLAAAPAYVSAFPHSFNTEIIPTSLVPPLPNKIS